LLGFSDIAATLLMTPRLHLPAADIACSSFSRLPIIYADATLISCLH